MAAPLAALMEDAAASTQSYPALADVCQCKDCSNRPEAVDCNATLPLQSDDEDSDDLEEQADVVPDS